MKKPDEERIKKIISIWSEVLEQVDERQITREKLLADPFLQWAMTTPLYNIGEQVYQISPEFKRKYPDVPWNKISGLRHRLVHDYEGTNWVIIADVLFGEMDLAVQSMKAIIQKPDTGKI